MAAKSSKSTPLPTRLEQAVFVTPAEIEQLMQLLRDGLRQEAKTALKRLARLPCARPEDSEALGFVAHDLGLHGDARTYYGRVVELAPHDPTAWYNLAAVERNRGDFDQAEAACDHVLLLAPDHAQAALLRSGLRVQTTTRNHVAVLRAMLRQVDSASAQSIFIHYALGKELDDLGEYVQAWHHFAEGAKCRRAILRYDVQEDVRKLQRIVDVFGPGDAVPPAAPARYGFIAGLPRSGTTLIERVLTGREGVTTNGETDNLFRALMDGTPEEGGDIFARVAAAAPDRVAASYVRRAGCPAAGGVVLEKLPFNYLYFGAIARTLPDAQMIILRRNLVDNCFAMFSTLFGTAYPFSYDMGDLGHYAIAFDRLVRHWRETLGDRLVEIHYDDFVADPTTEGPLAAHHLGIAWGDELLAIERNPTSTATASAAQVRRPIYRSASGRWRNYEKQLGPLIDQLGVAGVV